VGVWLRQNPPSLQVIPACRQERQASAAWMFVAPRAKGRADGDDFVCVRLDGLTAAGEACNVPKRNALDPSSVGRTASRNSCGRFGGRWDRRESGFACLGLDPYRVVSSGLSNGRGNQPLTGTQNNRNRENPKHSLPRRTGTLRPVWQVLHTPDCVFHVTTHT
jgi:hypothetical protein